MFEVKDNGQDFERPPVGTQRAVCIKVFDLGLQPGFQGVMTHKGVILWEIDSRMEKGEAAGKRFTVSKTYTASLNEKANLAKDLQSWRGRPFSEEEKKGFDLDKIVGKNCLLNLVETTTKAGKTWIAIAAVMPPMKGMEPMVQETPAEYVPQWVSKLLHPEATEQVYDTGDGPGADDSDIPF